jgi:8-oxo-dGTP diphosphatase
MTNQEPGIFRVVAAAVVINNLQQVLLTQRGLDRDHHAGEWEILSGRLDQGEDFQTALSREAMEELKIEVSILAPLNTFHFFRGSKKVEHVGVAFLAQHTGGEVKVDGVEEVAHEWLDFESAIERVNDSSIKENLKKAQLYLENNRD